MDSTLTLPIIALVASSASLAYSIMVRRQLAKLSNKPQTKRCDDYDTEWNVVQLGDTVVLVNTYDKKLVEWCEARDTFSFKVRDIDSNKEVLWGYGCPLPINIADVIIRR